MTRSARRGLIAAGLLLAALLVLWLASRAESPPQDEAPPDAGGASESGVLEAAPETGPAHAAHLAGRSSGAASEEDAGLAQAHTPEGEVAPWSAAVVLVDRGGTPVAGAPIFLTGYVDDEEVEGGRSVGFGRHVTNDEGRIDLTGLTTSFVQASCGSSPGWFRLHTIEPGENRIESERGLPLVIEAVDVTTGAPVEGVRWQTHPPKDGPPGPQLLYGGASGASFPTLPGEQLEAVLSFIAPAGWTVTSELTLDLPVSRDTERLLLRVPAFPAGSLQVRVTTTKNAEQPALITAHGGFSGERALEFKSTKLGGDLWRITGVPLLAGQRLELHIQAPGFLPRLLVVPLPGGTAPDMPIACELVPDIRSTLPLSAPPFPGELPSMGIGGSRTRRDPRAGRSTGTLDLTLRYADGRPFAEREVTLTTNGQHFEATTGPGGAIRLDGLEVGRIRVTFGDWIETTHLLDLAAGAHAQATLAEAAGATVRVRVQDRDRQPIPWAQIYLHAQRDTVAITSPAVRGVQRIDPYVDQDGTRVLTRIAKGEIKLAVSVRGVGGVQNDEVHALGDGETHEVVFTVKALPKRKR